MGRRPLPELAALRVKPVTLAREQTLEVLAPLRPLFALGGLQRGTTVAVAGGPSGAGAGGATSLALALAAGPSQAGSWVVVVGIRGLGLAAAAEAGLALERLALVAEPEPQSWGTVLASLVDAFDVVVVRGDVRRMPAAQVRRVQARARERGAVLVALGDLPAALQVDVTLEVETGEWEGVGDGHGFLRCRRVEVGASGRGGAARRRRVPLWLPGPDGRVREAGPIAVDAPVLVPVREAG